MAINVQFYSFAKRKNSTAIPSGQGTTVPCLLKDDCTQEDPILKIHSADYSSYAGYNYCNIPMFGRFYFINSKEVHNGSEIWLYCTEDYLGSFKSTIMGTTAFIAYSAQGSTRLPDKRISTTMDLTISHADAAFPSAVGGNNYFICMNGIRGVETYYVSRNDISDIFGNLDWSPITVNTGSDDKETIKNMGQAVVDALKQQATEGNAFRWLQSAYILPFPPDPEVLGSSKSIYAGFFDTQVDGEPLLVNVFSQAIAINIPWNYTDWRSLSPYTDVYLYLPFFGTISLDANSLIGSSYLTVKYSIAYSNGDLSYSVETQTNRIIATGKTNVKSDYSIGSVNGGGVLSGLAGAAAYDLGGMRDVYGSIPIVGKALGDMLNTAAGSVSTFCKGAATSGGLGGFSDCGLDLRLHCWVLTKNLSDSQSNFATIAGYPLMAVGSLSGHSGFIETIGFSLSSAVGTLKEIEAVNDAMDKGVYLE